MVYSVALLAVLALASAAPAPKPVAAPQREQKMHSDMSMSMGSMGMSMDMSYSPMGMSMTMGMGVSMMETAHGMGASMGGSMGPGGYAPVMTPPAGPFAGATCGPQLANASTAVLDSLTDLCTAFLARPAPPAPAALAAVPYELGPCTCHPESIVFSVTGDACGATTNYQSGKLGCSDVNNIALAGNLTVTSSDTTLSYDSATGMYTMTGVGAQTDLEIMSVGGVPAQSLSVHSSCSKPFGSGDVFGAITIEGYTCGSSSGGSMGMGGGSYYDAAARPDAETCDCHPVAFAFTYLGGSCSDMTHDQSGKYSCSGTAVTGPATITCDSGDSFADVAVGDQIILGGASGRLGAQTDCTVTDGTGTLTLSLHTSCSKLLQAGDVFGALQATAWDCGDGMSPAMPPTGDMLLTGMLDTCFPAIDICEALYLDPTVLDGTNASALMPGAADLIGCLCDFPPPLPPPVTLRGPLSDMDAPNVPVPQYGPDFSFFTCAAQPCEGVAPKLVTNGAGPCFEVSGGAPMEPMCVTFAGGEICSDPMPPGCCPSSCPPGGPPPMHLGVVVTYLEPPRTCECHPDAMEFTYVGGPCSQSTHDQSGKMTCSGGAPAGTATISCDSGDAPVSVAVGDSFILGSSGRLSAQTDCTITDASGTTQFVSIHTSCSKLLQSDDVYGALMVERWSCDGPLTDTTPMSPAAPAAPAPMECDCHPTCLAFTYSGSDCTFTQDQSGKFSCSGDALSGPATIAASDETLSTDTLSDGDVVTVGCADPYSRIGAQTDLMLTDGTGTQSLSIHTSCSKRLAVGDKFGSLTLTGFNCSSDGYGMGGAGGSMMSVMGMSMMGMSYGAASVPEPMAQVMVSFYADGELVTMSRMPVPINGGIHTCAAEDAVVAEAPTSPAGTYQQGNTQMFPVAVPALQVAELASTADCTPGCETLPSEYDGIFTYVPPTDGLACGYYTDNTGVCSFNPLCSMFASSDSNRVMDGLPRPRGFDPATCVTCYCGPSMFCTETPGVDDQGRDTCGSVPSACQPAPDPKYCIDASSAVLQWGDTVTVTVDDCGISPITPDTVIDCSGMTLSNPTMVGTTWVYTETVGFDPSTGLANMPVEGSDPTCPTIMQCSIPYTGVTGPSTINTPTCSSGSDCADVPCSVPIDVTVPSPSPSPSVQPYYQIKIMETQTLCVTEGCVQREDWDNYTTIISMWYERGVPDTSTSPPLPDIYIPPIDDLTNMPALSDISLYTVTPVGCYDPTQSTNCQRLSDPRFANVGQTVRDTWELDCQPCVNSEWSPTFFSSPSGTSYAPAVTPASTYPNVHDWQAISMVISCEDVLAGPHADKDAQRVVTFPMGPDFTQPGGTVEGGPCWVDPDFGGETVCAPGGGDPDATLPSWDILYDTDGNFSPAVRDVNGQSFPQAPDANGDWPRWLGFQCPSASSRKKDY